MTGAAGKSNETGDRKIMKAITIKADPAQQEALEMSIVYVLLNMETCEDGLQIDGDLSSGIIVNRRLA